MKQQEVSPKGINELADSVVRNAAEPEDIDLAAEATESAPAKSLKGVQAGRKATVRQKESRRSVRSGSPPKK